MLIGMLQLCTTFQADSTWTAISASAQFLTILKALPEVTRKHIPKVIFTALLGSMAAQFHFIFFSGHSHELPNVCPAAVY